VWAMFENRPFTRVASLPSHRRLAREGTVLTQYFAVSHPSGPNYRAMASGETWGHSETIDTFHPSVASEAAAISPPVPTYIYHLGGRIPRKHDPFTDLHAPIASARSGLGALQNDLRQALPEACLIYVGWDDDNNMHNGNPARADRNLMALLNTLAVSRWFTTPDGSGRYPALFFCYDEDDGGGDNRVFAAWWGRGVRTGHVSGLRHTHYGFCRTVSDNWGLRPLGRAAAETPIEEVWV
jgi:phosphatidylinositol-3-phosphatase